MPLLRGQPSARGLLVPEPAAHEDLGEREAHAEPASVRAPPRSVRVGCSGGVGSPITQTNRHPFRHGRWLFVHNGYVGDFQVIRRDLMLAIDPELFAGIVGSTDTEVVFRLALMFGLEEDPMGALERTVGLIEATATEHGVAPMVQGTFGVSDGSSLWAVRYATEGRARSLFASADVDSLHQLYPEKQMWFATAMSTTG